MSEPARPPASRESGFDSNNADTSAAEATVKDEHFDLYLLKGENYFWSIGNRGVTVMSDRLAFTLNGVAHEGRFADIREIRIHLQAIIAKGSGGGSVGWCRILFADGYALNIISGDSHGLVDAEQNAIYLNFIPELHHRLSKEDKGRIRFIAGLSEGRHLVLMLCAGLLAVMSLIPLFVFFYSGEWKVLPVLPVLIGAIGLAYPLWKNAEANRPRMYNPDSLPDDLVPEA